MNRHPSSEERIDQAAAWFVKLEQDEASEADWLAFCDWIAQDRRNDVAFAAVEAAWVGVESKGLAAPSQGGRISTPVGAGRRGAVWSRGIGIGGAIAASVAGLVLIAQSMAPPKPAPSAAQVIEASRTQTRTIELADGSVVHLNRGARIAVASGGAARNVQLLDGEAAFEVVHDPSRPFVVSTGGRTIRVLGTQFDVKRQTGRLQVTVRQGVVSVEGEGSGSPALRLVAGDRYEKLAAAEPAEVRQVDPEDAFAWRRGVLIYHDRPLSEVCRDLAPYLSAAISLDDSARGLRFTGVLRIESEAAMLRNLESFLPVTIDRGAEQVSIKARART